MGLKTDKTIIHLGIEELNTISAQLYDEADKVTQITLQDLARNIRLAGPASGRHDHARPLQPRTGIRDCRHGHRRSGNAHHHRCPSRALMATPP